MKSRRPAFAWTGLLAATLATGPSLAEELDAIALDLEDLAKVRILATPKFAENPEQIASVVSILRREDIRLYGWRTLGEVLRSLQGFNITNDHTYQYAGVRGISPPGDFRPRLQILIDGSSVIENIYASALLDSAFPLDLDLVERIEVVRGPSASVYGGEAMFGVINVITRSGAGLGGAETSLALGSGDARQLRLSWGGTLGGADVVVSATGFDADGQDQGFEDLGQEDGRQLFLAARGVDWRFTLLHGDRERTVPTGSYDSIVNDPGHQERDRMTVADWSGEWRLDDLTRLHQRVFAGDYRYNGEFPIDYSSELPPDPRVVNRDTVQGTWLGYEGRIETRTWAGQKLTLGLEFKRDTRRSQENDDIGYGCYPGATGKCLDSDSGRNQFTLYVQDEIQIGTADLLTAGLRYDRVTDAGSFWSPRLGYVHDAGDLGLIKFLFATGFHTPSAYETDYLDYGNPDLDSESMQSLELAWEKRLDARSRLTATLYGFRIEDLVGTDAGSTTDQAVNGSTVHATGLELEYQRQWDNRSQLRTSYSLQRARNADGTLDNSPRHMVKLNGALPLGRPALMAGAELQWVSARDAGQGTARADSFFLANLNLSYTPPGAPWEASLGIYNLFDQDYEDPVTQDNVGWTMPQLGRSIRAKAVYRF